MSHRQRSDRGALRALPRRALRRGSDRCAPTASRSAGPWSPGPWLRSPCGWTTDTRRTSGRLRGVLRSVAALLRPAGPEWILRPFRGHHRFVRGAHRPPSDHPVKPDQAFQREGPPSCGGHPGRGLRRRRLAGRRLRRWGQFPSTARRGVAAPPARLYSCQGPYCTGGVRDSGSPNE